jgi:hypothetical protein
LNAPNPRPNTIAVVKAPAADSVVSANVLNFFTTSAAADRAAQELTNQQR